AVGYGSHGRYVGRRRHSSERRGRGAAGVRPSVVSRCPTSEEACRPGQTFCLLSEEKPEALTPASAAEALTPASETTGTGRFDRLPAGSQVQWRTDNPVRPAESAPRRRALAGIHGLTDRIVRP